jgi:hypothetical protein
MLSVESELENESHALSHEYSVPESQRRSRHGNKDAAPSHRRLRLFYFVIASIWGFLSGAVGVGAALAARGRPLGIEDPVILFSLVSAMGLALAGGAITAAAYRAARRRSG